MSAPRFFSATPLHPGETVVLPPPIAHHAVRVLRLGTGDEIVLFDGRGGEIPASLLVEGGQTRAHLGEHRNVERELPGPATLAQGLASGEKMEWIIEKSVELGVSRFVPIAAERSVLQLRGERLERRLQQWRRIVQAASEQCGRNRLMEVEPPSSLADFVQRPSPGTAPRIFCHPEADRHMRDTLSAAPDGFTILVGPEGGWSDRELAAVSEQGLVPVRFGERVLRTETAGLALVSAATALLGWQ